MGPDILKQAARFLGDRKHNKRWLAIILCLAVIAAVGTVRTLKYTGHSMTHKEKVLTCTYQPHQHTDSCYNEAGNLICGLADFVLHTHNDDCYDLQGNLVCQLPEIKPHHHTDECYAEKKVLICGKEETDGHTHSAECYDENGNLICGQEEQEAHHHTDECYGPAKHLICGQEEQEAHHHDASCYDEAGNLICGKEETDGHHHTDECYEVEKELVCGQTECEEHIHTDECYDENGKLICGKLQVETHVHTGDACFTIKEMTADEVATLNHENNETGSGEQAAESTDNVILKKTCTSTDGNVEVTAEYTAEAQIPENAELRAQPTAAPEGEDTVVGAVYYDIGFYLNDEEVEPNAAVTVTMKFLNGTFADENSVEVTHYGSDNTDVFASDVSSSDDGTTITFELNSFSVVRVAPNAEVSTQAAKNASISIANNIKENGALTASVQNYDAKGCHYVWYRSEDNQTWTKVEQVQYVGGLTNVSSEKLYVSVDWTGQGKRYPYYKVELQDNGNAVIAASSVTTVDYYDSLQNGSFEKPKYSLCSTQVSNSAYKSNGGVWQTTGLGKDNKVNRDIEIINVTTQGSWNGYTWYNGTSTGTNAIYKDTIRQGSITMWAPEGNQFAELNCEAAGALYQDVLTTPGQNLNWWLNHRARGSYTSAASENDTMYLLIMSTEQAEKLDMTDTNTVNDVIAHIENYSGAQCWKFTSDDQTWHYYSSDGTEDVSGKKMTPYTVPEGQYMTRFFFVAGDTASKNNTVGNFLDNVGFSTGLPPVKPNSGNITIEKTLEGVLDAENVTEIRSKIKFNVTGAEEMTISGTQMNWTQDEEGKWVGTYTLQNKANGSKYTITEDTSTASCASTTLEWTKVSVDKGEQTKSNTITDVTVESDKTKTVNFVNHYKNISHSETAKNMSKYIKYNSTADTYDLTLTFTPPTKSVQETVTSSTSSKAKLDVLMVIDTSGSMSQNSKLTKTKNAAEELITSITGNKNIDARWKLITFAGDAAIKTTSWVTNGTTFYNSYINVLTANGGTNYQDALVQAQTQVNKNTRADAQRIVIFLTDGEPTYHNENGKAVRGGGSYTKKADYDGAITGAQALNCDQFYAVGLGLGSGTVYTDENGNALTAFKILENVSGAVQASSKQTYNASASTLVEQFKNIAENIEHSTSTVTKIYKAKNVTITDNLSKYVDIVEGSEIKISVVDAAGNEMGTSTSGTIGGSNASYVVEGQTLTATWEQNNKRVKLNFPSDYELNPNYTYKVTFTVKASDKAYEEYAENEYNGTVGDANTDAPDNNPITSSGQPGFRSNTSATVKYTIGTETSEPTYPHPVIQVQKIGVKLLKTAAGTSNTQLLSGATFKLYADADHKQPYPDEQNNTFTTGDEGVIFNMSLKPGTYYLVETQAPDGYMLPDSHVQLIVSANGITIDSADKITDKQTDENGASYYQGTITNSTGVTMPATGGSGILPYLLTGLALTSGAAFLLYRSMRRKEDQ